MVLVFHLNRRLIHHKCLCLTAVVILLFFVHTFEITYHFLNDCPREEPIDVVYTWVNGSDPRFAKLLNTYLRKETGVRVDSSAQRYDDKNELKFSLRSLEKFAPWIRHVYIVTNGQIPHWLNLDYDKVSLITHDEIFTDKYNLPTFSSPAIELHLHRIPGLSKRFIYFNDDVFLRSPIYKDDFISPSRGFLIYLAWLLPMCSPDCSWLYVADGHCDNACNNPNCQMDGGDCDAAYKTLLGDVIVKLSDYDAPEQTQQTNYDKILFTLQNTTSGRNFSVVRHLQNNANVSELIAEHNKKVIQLDKLKRRKLRKKLSGEYKLRRSVDAYAASLQHTNRVLNEFYGFSVRKVPAHAPILIDKEIMEEAQKKFRRYFAKTARNRFRSVDDVQFAFAYYYFVIHEKVEVGIDEIFTRFDTDSSGIWSETEIRTVMTKLYDLPISDESFGQFTSILMNCSGYSPKSDVFITKEIVTGCNRLSFFLQLNFGIRHKYKFEMIKDAEKKHVFFKMLNSNVTEVFNQLDEIRKNTKKFVCLNDNLDQVRSVDNQMIKRLMLDFYMSLFPIPSKFELPEQYRNRFLYIKDYVAMVEDQQRRFLLASVLVIFLSFVLFLNFFKRRICELIQKIFC